jgi:hypothetical protein
VCLDGNFSISKVVQVKGTEKWSPNSLKPFTIKLKLVCSHTLIGGKIIVANAGGREPYKMRVTAQMITTSTSHLPAGIYYVNVIEKMKAMHCHQRFAAVGYGLNKTERRYAKLPFSFFDTRDGQSILSAVIFS